MEVEREKCLERELALKVRKLGGWSIKVLSTHVSGLPDRLCMLPGGKVFFAEIKTTGEKPRKIQLYVHKKIRSLGFRVEVIDRSKQITEILKDYDT